MKIIQVKTLGCNGQAAKLNMDYEFTRTSLYCTPTEPFRG